MHTRVISRLSAQQWRSLAVTLAAVERVFSQAGLGLNFVNMCSNLRIFCKLKKKFGHCITEIYFPKIDPLF